MQKNKIQMGFIGLRNNGQFHVQNAVALENVNVRALADIGDERLAKAKALVTGETVLYKDADELLQDSSIDAVVLSLPNQLHASYAIKAMEQGKHVLVEKPIATCTKEAEAMIAVRDQTGKTLMVGMNQRFDPNINAIKNAVSNGAIGKISHGKTRWNLTRPFEGLWQRGDWFLSRKNSGGGPLLDLGIHRLDLALYLMGFPEVESVNGMTFSGIGCNEALKRGKEYGIEDGGVGFIRFMNGTTLFVEAAYFINDLEMTQDTFIYGNKGGISLTDSPTLIVDKNGELSTPDLEDNCAAPTSCVEHFANVLAGNEALIPTAEEALAGLKIMEMIYESAATGKTIYS